MAIELIQTNSKFINLRDEWNSLLEHSASHVPFLRHEYLTNWWRTLGGGEWDQGELVILLDRKDDGTLMGIAPLFRANHQLRFLGSVEISDFLDLISPPDYLDQFTHKILQFVQTDHFPSWQSIILENLMETSSTIQSLEQNAANLGLSVEQKTLQPAPYIDLPSSWEGYLNKLEDRYRREMERKMRKAEDYFLDIDWYIVDETKELKTEMDDFLELMANNPEKKKFLTDAMRQQMISGAETAYQEGWLQLVFLVVGEVKIAGYINFDFNNKIWIYNSGINPTFENLSPGWVLLTKIIQWAIQEGRTEVDFMRGDEKYKYQFGGIDKHVLKITLTRG